MANVTLQVQSLLNTAVYGSYTLANTANIATLKSSIQSNTGFDPSWYNLYYGSTALTNTSATLSSYGINSNVTLRSANRIGHLPTLQDRQVAKLNLAELDRLASGESRAYYDITELPTQYSGNTVVNNPNSGGLIEGRPWVQISYAFGSIPTSINEGSSGTFNVVTAGVADGTTLYWTVQSNAGDFSTSSGSFTVTGNAGSFTVTPTADSTTEGAETFTVAVRTGSTSGTIVATSNSVTINDTSITSPFVSSNLIMNLLTAPTSGSTWTDASGNGRNGTVRTVGTGSATYTSSNGGGLTLGPANNIDAAMISTDYTLPVTNWSVEIVADTTPNGYWATLFGSETYTTNLGHFMYWSSNTGVNIGKATNYNTYNAILPTSGGPRHIVVTVTGGVLRAYLNGTLLTPTTTNYIAPSNTGTATLNFGSRHPNVGTNNTPNDCMPGTYYQMRVYNKALSQAEVTQNYTASKAYTSGLP